MASNSSNNYWRGIWAEYMAALILMLKGYRILKLRAKTPVGEIDILVSKKGTLIAVEVKTSHSYDHASHKIDVRKQKRVTDALNWIRTQSRFMHYQSFRFDGFIIAKRRFYHIIDAW